jgi:hypothetical protein
MKPKKIIMRPHSESGYEAYISGDRPETQVKAKTEFLALMLLLKVEGYMIRRYTIPIQ